MAKKDVNLIVKKASDAMRSIGRAIVATETRQEHSVRDALIACKGYTPEQIEHVKEGIQSGYADKLTSLYAKAEHDLPDNFANVKQAVYNRRSEKLAVLDAFRLYAGFDAKETKAFDVAVEQASAYHALVSLCRTTVSISKGNVPDTATKTTATTVSSKGMSVTMERIERMTKDQLTMLIAKAQKALVKYIAPPSNIYAINKVTAKHRAQADRIAMQKPAKKARKAA